MKRIKIILPIIVLTIIAVYFVISGQNYTTKTSDEKTTKQELPKEITVILDKDGFKPSNITVKPGTAVRWKNESGERQTVNSNDYPTNQLHKELNFGIFEDGSSVVYIFKKPGKYGYHNQLKPEQKGVITVFE